ncbi:MAG: PIG-L family deacetylase [Acidimicrobiales bacterium]
MATLVCFHAHPDDECTQTAGVMAKAAAEGHRVVLVVATKGEHGEVPAGLLRDGELLWERRIEEVTASAAVLGVDRLEFLGYTDSGMMGTPENDQPESFWKADIDDAARRLAAILEEERADVLTAYDDHGNYGHPDHIQVHRVGVRAGELAGTPRVFLSTMNRDQIVRGMQNMREHAIAAGIDPDELPDLGDDFGSPESDITAAVDVRAHIDEKRKAMECHPSQIVDTGFFFTMPPEVFADAFGTEWYIRAGQGPGITETDLMAGL